MAIEQLKHELEAITLKLSLSSEETKSVEMKFQEELNSVREEIKSL